MGVQFSINLRERKIFQEHHRWRIAKRRTKFEIYSSNCTFIEKIILKF
jgi:hypothetical protein